jgi:hypothetical protein
MTYKILIGWLVLGAVPLGCTGDLNVGPFAPDASSEGSTGVVDDATTDGSGFDASMPETGVAQDAGPETSVADAGTDGSTDGGLCIEIPALAASDLSCDSDQDCTLARSGSVCSCQCSCPEAVANSAAYERIEALAEPALVWRSSCDSGFCGCVSDVLLHCFAHQCVACGRGFPIENQPAECDDDGGNPEASTPDGGGGDGSIDSGFTDSVDGGDAGVCVSDPIAFELTVDATGPVYYEGLPLFSSFPCGGWLKISPAGGPTLCVLGDCDSGCPAAIPQSAIPQSFTWDGTYYMGGASQGCAPVGNYVATICVGYAPEDASTDGGFTDNPAQGPPTCKQASFGLLKRICG